MISDLIVFVYLPGETQAVPAGVLRINEGEGVRSSAFAYSENYIRRKNAIPLDPLSLPLQSGTRKPVNKLDLFGSFRDATPDAWGRRVIEIDKGAKGDLPEADYILNASSERVGALDFRPHPWSKEAVTKINEPIDLEYLIDTADRIENREKTPAAMIRLFLHGSSMGGARAKTLVKYKDKIWLCKFPSSRDRFDYAKVEHATLALARECGLSVPDTDFIKVGDKNAFIIDRFDRVPAEGGKFSRIHYASSLTMLGRHESESHMGSYSEIAKSIAERCGKSFSSQNKEELFCRMVFNILCSNNDDHLRNHGFLLSKGGWVLSPLFDVVPNPSISFSKTLHLGVGDYGKEATLDNAVSSCHNFGLSEGDAHSVIEGMLKVVSGWREFYKEKGVSSKDIDTLESAFMLEERGFVPGYFDKNSDRPKP